MFSADLTWPQLKRVPRDTPIVIPVAAIEQHGHHLPVATDTLLLTEIVRRVEESIGDQILTAPVQWFGNSDHHLDFGGTLSAPPRVFLDMLNGVINNFLSEGFKRIVILNGHGGNDVPAKQALFEIRQEHRGRNDLLLAMTTYWSLGTEPWQDCPVIHQREMGHACEWETSMIMVIRPDLVGEYQSASPVEPGNPFRPGHRAWVTQDRSVPGHIGWPHLASVEKGEVLLNSFTRDVVLWLTRIAEWDGASWNG